MAGKKKDGIGGMKVTTGGFRRDDGHTVGNTFSEPVTVDAKNAVTVMHMLMSPEDNVVLRAVAALEGYAKKEEGNLRLLSSLQIFQYLPPLVHYNDPIIKRFAQKLIGMLCSLEEFREQMSTLPNILNKFVDILEKESDVVMHEYAALTLAEFSSEYNATTELLQTENCISTLFLRITSPDPDVEKNCLDVMNHLLDNINGVEVFIESPDFNINLILDLISSSYPVIQALAIEVLKQLTSWCRDTRVLFAFRDASGVETILNVLETETWSDLHMPAIDLLINVVDNPDLCDYLLQSGSLLRIINLLNSVTDKTSQGKILRVLARMSQTRKGSLALHSLEMSNRFSLYLQENQEDILEPACLGIAYMAQYRPSLEDILKENPTSQLLDITVNTRLSFSLRNMAAYALSTLCNEDTRAGESLLENPYFEDLYEIINVNTNAPTELIKNVIQIFIGMSFSERLRAKIISDRFMNVLLNCTAACMESQMKDPSVQMDILECLSGYLIENEGRLIFNFLGGSEVLIDCLRSKHACIREWAGQLIVEASQDLEFVKNFIRCGGLHLLIKEKTAFTMPSWQSAVDAIYSKFLPAKFAFTGRLDFQDITQDGFYISTHPRIKFCFLEDLLRSHLSPIFPVYVASFRKNTNDLWYAESALSNCFEAAKTELSGPSNGKKEEECDESENLSQNYSSDSSLNGLNDSESLLHFFPDPHLRECLKTLRNRLKKEESFLGDKNWSCIHPKLIRSRVQIIAKLVAEEMSGIEPNPPFCSHYKDVHISELKHQFGTNVFPLGYIRMGDYLERAMLFKVLSDRIGFPCALVRGPLKRAWIEIAIPKIASEDFEDESLKSVKSSHTRNSDFNLRENDTCQIIESHIGSCLFEPSILCDIPLFPKLKMECFKALPTCYLIPNAIVDLIHQPGRIFQINSQEAEEYRGGFLYQEYQTKDGIKSCCQ